MKENFDTSADAKKHPASGNAYQTEGITTATGRKVSDPAFAEKLRAFREARQTRAEMLATMERSVGELPPCPPVPRELFVTFTHPEREQKARPSEGGWTLEELKQIAGGQVPNGRPVWLCWLPSGDAIRQRAAELIPVREEHDTRREAWWKKVKAIEAVTAPYFAEEDRAAIAVILHPVSTLAEVRVKIEVAEEAWLFDHDDGDQFRDAIMRDVLTIA